jgi:Na+/H+-dicarboxylate symporter
MNLSTLSAKPYLPKMSWLLSPWFIFIGVFLGAIIGLYNTELAHQLKPIGSLYLKLLQMLVLPMLVTAVISGLGNLFVRGMERRQIITLITFLIMGLAIASLLGLLLGFLGHPGSELSHESQVILGKTISKTEQEVSEQIEPLSMFNYLQAIVPENIFKSLTSGDTLAVLFFSILTGISMGLLNTEANKTALMVVNGFYDGFLAIIGWMMYFLPFGLLCLFADDIAKLGLEIVWATARLIVFIYIACISSLIVYSLIMWWKLRHYFCYLEILTGLRQPLMVALGTASSLASIPAAINALKNNLHTDKNISDLIIPLGMTINPPASVLQFSISSIFIAQIYGMELGFNQTVIIFIGSILAGLASSSTPSIVGLTMIAMILDPLGLPSGVAIILLVAIDPVIDPIITALNVQANCTLGVVVSNIANDEIKIVNRVQDVG